MRRPSPLLRSRLAGVSTTERDARSTQRPQTTRCEERVPRRLRVCRSRPRNSRSESLWDGSEELPSMLLTQVSRFTNLPIWTRRRDVVLPRSVAREYFVYPGELGLEVTNPQANHHCRIASLRGFSDHSVDCRPIFGELLHQKFAPTFHLRVEVIGSSLPREHHPGEKWWRRP